MEGLLAEGEEIIGLDGEADVKDAALIAAAQDKYGPVDVFFSNAGLSRKGQEQASDSDWDVSWRVHVMSHVFAARALVPGRLQSLAEILYEFVANILQENAGKKGMQYFPFVFTLFMFILVANLMGMIPLSFTTTSHIIVTFALAMMVDDIDVPALFGRIFPAEPVPTSPENARASRRQGIGSMARAPVTIRLARRS